MSVQNGDMVVNKKLSQFLGDYEKQVYEEAQKLLSLSMPEVTEELFALFEQNGNRLLYENVYFTRRKFLTVLGLQALLEKRHSNRIDDKLLKKLIEVIRDVCGEECWALPAHVSRKSPDWRLTIDLFASETGQTISELADRFREELPEDVYCLMAENVERRILRPFVAAKEGYGWEKSDHNWNAVCAGSIGSACLHLMKERKEILEPCLKRVCESLPYYVEGFAEDGACMEGLGYFTYGMSYFVNFAQELYEYTQNCLGDAGKVDLLCGDWAEFHAGKQDIRARMAAFYGKCFFADGRTVSFSDGFSEGKYRMGLACALKRHFPQVQIPDMKHAAGLLEDNCYRFIFRRMDLLETEQYLNQLEKTEQPKMSEDSEGAKTRKAVDRSSRQRRCHVLPSAQWCIADSENGVGFACKGGHNGEPHNHNDVGNFIYESAGVILFADLGAGEYTGKYFSEERYEILCNNSFGHSVPIIAGCGQQTGKEYGCSSYTVDKNRKACVVRMELSGAYEKGLLERFRRHLCFVLKDGGLKVQDEFTLMKEKDGIVEENLITQIPPRVQEDGILLTDGTIRAILQIDGINTEREVVIWEYIHNNHYGKPEKVYAIRWQVPLRNRDGRCTYTINVLP